MKSDQDHRIRTLLGFLLLGVLLVAISSGALIALGDTSRPKPLGWLLAGAGVLLAITTVNVWARGLPVLFACAILNILTILIVGHDSHEHPLGIARPIAVLLLITLAMAAFLTSGSTHRTLSRSDIAAYVGFLVCFVGGAVSVLLPIANWEAWLFAGFFGCTLLGWLGRRAANRRR